MHNVVTWLCSHWYGLDCQKKQCCQACIIYLFLYDSRVENGSTSLSSPPVPNNKFKKFFELKSTRYRDGINRKETR